MTGEFSLEPAPSKVVVGFILYWLGNRSQEVRKFIEMLNEEVKEFQIVHFLVGMKALKAPVPPGHFLSESESLVLDANFKLLRDN